MSHKRKNKLDIDRAKEVYILKSMKGWCHVEEFFKIEEGKLSKKLMKVNKDEVDRIRGSLDFIQKFKIFLDMVSISGSEAIKELEELIQRK